MMDSPLSTMAEKQLLELLRGGDESSFTYLYNSYSKKIFLAAYATTKSKDTAKEIVQEIFVSVWLNRETLAIKNSFEAYLFGAVRHKVYDYYDKQTVRERYKSRMSATTETMINSTEESLHYDELRVLVSRQIEQLPETTRKVFISSRFNGASVPEIAKESSLSVKAVEYHLTKALKHLRVRLAELMVVLIIALKAVV